MEGLYIGAMGMLSNQNHIDTHSNNIANANSNGFKFDDMVSKVYEKNKVYRNESGERTFVGDYYNKVVNEGIITNLNPGQMKLTSEPLNVLVNDKPNEGVSFFVVNFNGKQMLTRNGEFEVSDAGHLKTMSGAMVLNTNNQPIIAPKGAEITINKEGMVVDKTDGQVIGKLQVRVINDDTRQLLNKEQSSMFSLEGNINDLPVSGSEIQVGVIELSNVDMGKEMVELLNSQRKFQANQKAFLTYDKILEKEANQLLR